MSKYLKYVMKNTAPVRIADDETSQHGQTDTLQHFPGSTIRGYVITRLSHDQGFEAYKRELLSGKIRFLNAYPCIENKEMIPSLKGFYEDKTETSGRKKLNNMMAGEVIPGYKRATLGSFCYMEDGCIRYSDVEVSEDVNINTGKENVKRNVFRNQYIRKNQTFSGYILFDDGVSEELIERVMHTFEDTMYLGNRRSAGYGACVCMDRALMEGLPYESFRTACGGKDLYMVLLSDTVMRDQNGELAGLCLEELADRLGCEALQIEKCATSVKDVRGYNRMWQGTIPSALMYEAGSVFHLKASSEITTESLRRLEQEGIGIRREEGFGQIAFFEEYPAITYKQAVQKNEGEGCEGFFHGSRSAVAEDIKIAAAGLVMHRLERAMERYVVERELELPGVSASKKGLLMSMCMELRYQPQEAQKQILAFVDHDHKKDEQKKIHDGKKKQDALYKYVHSIFETDLYVLLGIEWKDHRVMGMDIDDIFSADEIIQYKLKLMVRQLKYANRGGRV